MLIFCAVVKVTIFDRSPREPLPVDLTKRNKQSADSRVVGNVFIILLVVALATRECAACTSKFIGLINIPSPK